MPNPNEDENYNDIVAPISNEDGTFKYDQVCKHVERSKGFYLDNLSNLTPGVSSYPGFSRRDYDYFRPSEVTPTQDNKIVFACNMAYKKVGLVKNIIDLMGDFGCQGVRVTHPNKKIERFYKSWFKQVNGVERSERFLNILYRLGTVIMKIDYAKITMAEQEEMSKVTANDKTIKIPKAKIKKKEIPGKYTFLHPCIVDTIGGRLSGFSANPKYGICLSQSVKDMINNPTTDEEKDLVKDLPQDILDIAQSNKPYVLPQDNLWVAFYKKDDWDVRGESVLASILDDIAVLEKLKLADITALDGACSMVRIYKLGNMEHKIPPSEAEANKLASALSVNVSAGVKEIIWGPAIEMLESKTDISNFLGEEKYRPTLNNIYTGLGIPPSLTGLFGTSGATNNFISLKTLTRRLEYGRQLLTKFWEAQIALVQKAMGFRLPAQVEFDNVNLTDEEAEKSLLIQLADRSLISDELLQIKFGHNPDMERIRLKGEKKMRENGKMVEKAGPYYDPMFELALTKIALQAGMITPGEAGLELDERKPGEKTALELNQETNKQEVKNTVLPKPNEGRPKNKKDTQKRDRRTFKPIKGDMAIWAKGVQNNLYDRLNALYLSLLNKKSLRQLTDAESKFIEKTKFGVFLSVGTFTNVNILDDEWIRNSIGQFITDEVYNSYIDLVKSISDQLDRTLTSDELRYLQLIIYINKQLEDEE